MRGKLAPNSSESTAVPVASSVSGYRPPPLPFTSNVALMRLLVPVGRERANRELAADLLHVEIRYLSLRRIGRRAAAAEGELAGRSGAIDAPASVDASNLHVAANTRRRGRSASR